jgi:NAD-dependent SIR2 family protein deacetylase
MDPYRVLERGGGADLAEEAGVLRLFRMRGGPLTFGCIRCGREHRSRMVAVAEDRELICRSCHDLLRRAATRGG